MKRSEPTITRSEFEELEKNERHYMTQKGFLNEDLCTCEQATSIFLQAMRIGATIPAGSIFQIQSVKNVSVPRRNQEDRTVAYDPRTHLLRFTVTDGFTNCIGLLSPPGHPKLVNTTMPGTKIQLMKPANLVNGILLMDEHSIDYLGGYVESMVKQWKLTNQLEMSRAWGSEVTPLDGEIPPPWRPLGEAVNIGNKKELGSFKAMAVIRDSREGQAQGDDITEFEAVRKEAIADLIRKAQTDQRKTFAEGKQLTNKDILSITSEGFTEDEARITLKRFKNNRPAALKFLIERRDGTRAERRKPIKSKYGGDDDSEPEPEPDPTHQPSRDITLFGFIQPAIPKEEAEMNKAIQQSLDADFAHLLALGGADTEGSGSDRERSSRGRSPRGSDGRRGRRGGRFGGRSDRGRGRQHYNESTPSVQKQVYEPYRGRPTDFPAMGEVEREAALRPQLHRDDSNRQSNSLMPSRPMYRPQGVSNTFDDYGAERADKQSRRQYKPFEQEDKERGYRESGNHGRSTGPTTGDTYNRSFASTQYRSSPQAQSSVSNYMPRSSAPPAPTFSTNSSFPRSQVDDYFYGRQFDRNSEVQSQSRNPFSASTAYTQAPTSAPVQHQRSNPVMDFFAASSMRGNNNTQSDRDTWNPRSTATAQPVRQPQSPNWPMTSNGIAARERAEWERDEELDQLIRSGRLLDYEDDFYNRSGAPQSTYPNSGFSQNSYSRQQY